MNLGLKNGAKFKFTLVFILRYECIVVKLRNPEASGTKITTNNMRHLSEEERVEIVALKRAGLINAQIARRIKCSASTLQQVLDKFHKYHTVRDLPKPGRPKVLGRWERQQLRNGIYRNEFDNAEEARRNLSLQCSTRTVRRELARIGAQA